ncbi:MAG: DUF6174 domain-containing protein, partial [Acidimicrobiia bacterium]
MRGFIAVVALSVLVAACGQPGSTGDPAPAPPETQTGSVCHDFIDATSVLNDESDYDSYVSILNEAALPVYDVLLEQDLELPQQIMMSWENLAYGNPSNDDLEAIHHVGGLLVSEIGPICEELGRNLGSMPLSPDATPGEPPAVELRPLYEVGTVDHACDVFIQTLFGWSDARSSGTEIGTYIADLTDQLIDRLGSHGIDTGLEHLAIYAEKYRTLPIIQAHEEAEAYLAAASGDLATHSVACGHMNTWDPDSDRQGVDVVYYRFRWDALGYDDYTARIRMNDPDSLRGEQQLVVVVRDGALEEVYDIRTAQLIEPPSGVPLTVDEMFDAVESGNEEHTSFHPVLGYPSGVDQVHVGDLSEGTDFDRSILGSTADATATVEAVSEFTPG